MSDENAVVVEANTIPGSSGSAVRDGAVEVMIAKIHTWMTPSHNYSGAQSGLSVHPAGRMILRVPVEGAQEGDVLTPLQLGEILQTLMSSIIPACGAFVTAREGYFGAEIKDEPVAGADSGDF